MTFKPMLAGKLEGEPRFPVLVSAKLDGIRATVQGGVVLSRSLKPIPNIHVQKLFGRPELEGLDGELIVGDPGSPSAFNRSTAVMAIAGQPAVTFHVFDSHGPEGFEMRLKRAERIVCALKRKDVQLVPHNQIHDMVTLDAVEEIALASGYEGLVLRSLHGPYKQGRSTSKEGTLLKLKRYEDGEGEILDLLELERNENTAYTNERGRTQRSSSQDGKVAGGTLGAFLVRNVQTGVIHKASPFGTHEERQGIWDRRSEYIGRILKFKHQVVGSKDKPRFPVGLGIRAKEDM